MNYFRYIKTPDNSINESIFFTDTTHVREQTPDGSGYWPGQWHQHSSVFTKDFITWLEQFNCKLIRAEAFRVYPHKAMSWHNDTNDDPNVDDLEFTYTTKINFMWGDLKNCFMEYGELTDPINNNRKISQNGRGRRAYVYDPSDMKILERFSLENTVLINQGPAHRVSNESDEIWRCLSCIILDTETGKPLLYEKALEIFDSVIIR